MILYNVALPDAPAVQPPLQAVADPESCRSAYQQVSGPYPRGSAELLQSGSIRSTNGKAMTRSQAGTTYGIKSAQGKR